MKILLGDNQFFGVNHFDLEKGNETKKQFDTKSKIESFIKDSLQIGLDGFMINSHQIGYELLSSSEFDCNKEIHYSIPYAHKYASMVNENGMLSLLSYLYKNSSMLKSISVGIKLILTKNIKEITPLAINLEVPNKLRKGSYIYVQNIMTDLLIGMGRSDVLIKFIENIVEMGYKPGIITLNPIFVENILSSYKNSKWMSDLIICFNINKEGFNVFPSLSEVENLIKSKPRYKLMGMSIFASGSANIPSSIEYIRSLNLDYIVFGSSKIENIRSNLTL